MYAPFKTHTFLSVAAGFYVGIPGPYRMELLYNKKANIEQASPDPRRTRAEEGEVHKSAVYFTQNFL